MYDVLEGIAPYEMKEMLKVMITNGFFSINELNNIIETSPYADSDSKDKPSIIAPSTLYSRDHKLNQQGT